MRSWLAFVVIAAAGCRVGTLSPEELERQYPVARLTTLSPTGMAESLADLREAVGGRVRITRLSFGEDRTTITAQSPRIASNYDSYTYYDGNVSSSPVTMRGEDEQRMSADLFDLDSVPLDKLGELARKALTALPLDDAHVESLDVSRRDDGSLMIEVYLESPRRRGRVQFDAKGAVLMAKQD